MLRGEGSRPRARVLVLFGALKLAVSLSPPMFLSRRERLPFSAATDVPKDIEEECNTLCERNKKVHRRSPRVLRVCRLTSPADHSRS